MKAVACLLSMTENPDWLNRQEADCRRYADERGLTVYRGLHRYRSQR